MSVQLHRNHSCVLFGVSWGGREWTPRLTHIYLGAWYLTITTGAKR